MAKFSLSAAETDIIMFLANNPGYDTAADISKVRRILKSQVSVSVKSLCEKGLLTGTYKDGNKKSVHLSLTAKAKPVVTYGKKEQSDFAAVLFDGFTDDEIAAFERYHIKILDNINRKKGATNNAISYNDRRLPACRSWRRSWNRVCRYECGGGNHAYACYISRYRAVYRCRNRPCLRCSGKCRIGLHIRKEQKP